MTLINIGRFIAEIWWRMVMPEANDYLSQRWKTDEHLANKRETSFISYQDKERILAWVVDSPKIQHPVEGDQVTDLRGIVFSSARLIETYHMSRHLAKAHFIHSFLDRVKLQSAYLENSTFLGATLDYCQLSPIYARRVDFRCTTILRSYLMFSDLQEADFRFARVVRTGFDSCNLQRAKFAFAVFEDCNFHDSDMRGVKFFATHIHGGQLAGAKIDDTRANRRMVSRSGAEGGDRVVWSPVN